MAYTRVYNSSLNLVEQKRDDFLITRQGIKEYRSNEGSNDIDLGRSLEQRRPIKRFFPLSRTAIKMAVDWSFQFFVLVDFPSITCPFVSIYNICTLQQLCFKRQGTEGGVAIWKEDTISGKSSIAMRALALKSKCSYTLFSSSLLFFFATFFLLRLAHAYLPPVCMVSETKKMIVLEAC